MPSYKSSFSTLIFLIAIYVASFFYYSMWHFGAKGGDPLGYYTYLPATFIYKDITDLEKTNLARAQQFEQTLNGQYYEENGLAQQQENGNKVLKYTCGVAITAAPFFGIAHLLAPILGYTVDGFSPIYLFAFYFAGFLYVLLGLYLLRKILLKYFKDQVVAWVLLLIALGTNLYFFAVYHSVMAHASLFFLHLLVIYSTIQLYAQSNWKSALGLGIALGLIILIRPVEIIVLLIPVLWGLPNLKIDTLLNRWNFIKQHQPLLLLIIMTIFLIGLPQLLYWKVTTGNFLYYSYGEEGFNFLKPQIVKGLFSYANGWLAYTPMMYFALVGLIFLYPNKAIFQPVVFFLLLHIYITYSWWCWNYINGFGSRPMVEVYGLLSFPLAYYWERIRKKYYLWMTSIVLSLLFLFLNLFNTWQFSKGLLWSEAAKKEYFFSMIGQTKMDYEDLVVYDSGEFQPDTSQLTQSQLLYFNDFETNNSKLQFSTEYKISKQQSCYLNTLSERVEFFRRKMKDLELIKGQYIKTSIWAMKESGTVSIYESSILAIRFETNKGKGLKTRRIRINNKIANPSNNFWGAGEGFIWDKVVFFSKIPSLPAEAELVIYLENESTVPIYVDDLKVEVVQ